MKYQNLSNGTLVKICYDLYKSLESSGSLAYNLNIEDLYKFTKKIYGFTSNSVVDLSFLYACFYGNFDLIKNKSLNKDNIMIPEKKKFSVKYMRLEERLVRAYYNYDLELYTSDEDFVDKIVDSDEWEDSEPYWRRDPDDEDWRDTTVLDTDTRITEE